MSLITLEIGGNLWSILLVLVVVLAFKYASDYYILKIEFERRRKENEEDHERIERQYGKVIV
jgi:hypothetical protein